MYFITALVSASKKLPNTKCILEYCNFLNLNKIFNQLQTLILLLSFISGEESLFKKKPSYEKRVTSEIQFSFNFEFKRGKTRRIFVSRTSIRILTCMISFRSIVLKDESSQGLATKE